MTTKKKVAATAPATIISYKGFTPDMQCRDYQFKIGESYKVSGRIRACENGFHACENPLDVLSYYELTDGEGRLNRFAIVEQGGDISRHDDDTKIASAEITIKAELKLPEFVKAAVDCAMAWLKPAMDEGKTTASEAVNASSGYNTQNASSGDNTQNASSGDNTKNASSGYNTKNASSGDNTHHDVTGTNSVVAAAGPGTTVKAVDGTWVSLAEFDAKGKCIGFATGCIGQNGLGSEHTYKAKAGKLVRV